MSTVIMGNSVAVAIQSAKFITDSLSAISKLKLDAATLLRVNDAFGQVASVQAGLLDAQQKLMDQQGEIRDLRCQIEKFTSWEKRANNYEMVQTAGGAIVWKSLSGLDHYACPLCFENSKLTILQFGGSGYSGTWDCKTCEKSFRLDVPQAMTLPRSSQSEW
jgi:hypothetical protein